MAFKIRNFQTLIVVAVDLALALQAYAAPLSDPNEWRPDTALVARVDSQAVQFALPSEFGSITAYSRYYWGTVADGRRVVDGVLIAPGVAKAIGRSQSQLVNIVPETSAPAIADGGCDIVSIQFDVESGKITDARCNFQLPVPPPPPAH